MKTIIAGSRSFRDYDVFCKLMKTVIWEITEVVSGHALGVDLMGERYARENCIPLKIFSADWEHHGKSAGYIRNLRMAENAEALVAFWDGKSKGTQHMIKIAEQKHLKYIVINVSLLEISND